MKNRYRVFQKHLNLNDNKKTKSGWVAYDYYIIDNGYLKKIDTKVI